MIEIYKNEFECFYKEFEKSIKLNIKNLIKKGYIMDFKDENEFLNSARGGDTDIAQKKKDNPK